MLIPGAPNAEGPGTFDAASISDNILKSIETQNRVDATDKLRWLSPNEQNGEHIALVSYPRSGNSLMRGLLEEITGIYTGSDTRPDRSLSKELIACGMKGEGIVDESVWFVKSHYPERLGWQSFQCKKAIVVVRNPWDAIDSYFNMTLTNSHNISLHESQYTRFQGHWDGLLRNEIRIWMKFHQFWIKQNEIPVMFVRYEDLMMHRAETLRRVFLFITDKTSLDETEWPERIASVLDGIKGPYVPRKGKIGASFSHYSEEQFQYILKTARTLLKSFGYDQETHNFPDNIQLPNRQVKHPTPPTSSDKVQPDSSPLSTMDSLANSLNQITCYEIRKKDDPYGRMSTWYRKRLINPVISSDGQELNMEEVLFARKFVEEKQKKKASASKKQ